MAKGGRENRADDKMIQNIERGVGDPFTDSKPLKKNQKAYKRPEHVQKAQDLEKSKIDRLKALRLALK